MADDCGTLDGRVGDVSGHRGRWRARIRVGGRRVSLGIYDTPEEARAAVAAAKGEIVRYLRAQVGEGS